MGTNEGSESLEKTPNQNIESNLKTLSQSLYDLSDEIVYAVPDLQRDGIANEGFESLEKAPEKRSRSERRDSKGKNKKKRSKSASSKSSEKSIKENIESKAQKGLYHFCRG